MTTMTLPPTIRGGTTRDVLIVGGGISGLTVAWHLRRAGLDIALLEAGQRVGGSIATEHRDGFLLEKGPFNVIVRDPAFEELLAGLADRIKVVSASPQAKKRYIYRHGDIHAVPTGPIGLLHTPLLSFGGACRAMRGLLISRRGRGEPTIAEFAARRFGAEIAETLVSAAVAGILAGDIHKLSAYDCFPVLRDFDRKSFSPLGRTLRRTPNMIRKRRNPKLRPRWRGLVSIDRGLGGLCEAMGKAIAPSCLGQEGAAIQTHCRVEALHRTGGGFLLSAKVDGERREFGGRRLVLATPARETARLVETLAPETSRLLNTIESASITVVNLAFRRSEVGHPLDGFGFLVPANEPDFPLMGVLWADSAFPHHAPPEYRLLRAFFGGARTPNVIARSTDELARTALTALRGVLRVRGEPVLVDVCPYPAAIPQYYLGHAEKVAEIRRLVADVPGLTLAGNYLDGVSINDCIKLGKQVAVSLLREPSPITV